MSSQLGALPAIAQRSHVGAVLLRWHRRLGVVACLGVLMWGVSGITHPFMSRLKPAQATQAPPAQHLNLTHTLPLTQVLAQHNITALDGFRTLSWAGQDYYQVRSAGNVYYFDARSGAAIPDGDPRYAEFLARHYLGDPRAPMRRIEPVTEFGGDYTFVNRFLPVYRVEFDRPDRMHVYVDTQASRLGTLVDRRKTIFQNVFRTLHNWGFLGFNETARVGTASIFIGAAFISACSGLWLYGFLWRRGVTEPGIKNNRRGLRRHHRAVGLTVAATTLMFSLSGLLHLVTDAQRRQDQAPAVTARIEAADLGAAGFHAMQSHASSADHVTLVKLPQGIYYRIASTLQNNTVDEHAQHAGATAVAPAPSPSARYINARSGTTLANGEALHARYLAGAFSGLPAERIQSVIAVTRHEGEYNAFYKRLPVYRVEYSTPARDRYYVETATGELAAHLQDSGLATAENWMFDNLHKWHFLDGLGPDKWARDIMMILFALGNVTVALLGLTLFLRRGK